MAIAPQNCVYVGDDRRDIVAGRAAGMKVIVAKFGYLNGNDPETWNADAMIERPIDHRVGIPSFGIIAVEITELGDDHFHSRRTARDDIPAIVADVDAVLWRDCHALGCSEERRWIRLGLARRVAVS